MRIGIALPQEVPPDGWPPAMVPRYARRAERLGFDGLWAQESVRGAAATVEPLILLAAAAAATTKIELGVAAILSAYRSPIQLARSIASLDVLSGGRLWVGLALGERGLEAGFGLPPGSRVRRFEEGVDLLRRLMSSESVTWQGDLGRLEEWPAGLRPFKAGGPPIWLGGHQANALARAVRLADGWIGAGGQAMAPFLESLATVRRLTAEHRPGERFGTGKRIYLAVGHRRNADRERLRNWFRRRQGDPDRADQVAIAADPPGLVEALAPLLEAGLDWLVLSPVFDERRQLETLGAEVLPALRVRG